MTERPPPNLPENLFEQLQRALTTVETFISTDPSPKQSLLEKILHSIRHLLPSFLLKRAVPRKKKLTEWTNSQLATAVTALYHHHLNSPISPNSEEEELRERIGQALESFHALTERKEENGLWQQRFFHYFIKKKEPLLNPKRIALASHQSGLENPLSFANLTPQESDLFRMKAITLCQSQEFSSVAEALRTIRNSPIYSQVALDGSQELSLSQTLCPFPGELLIVTGSLRKTQGRTAPLSKSFKLTRLAEQTGFPHPLQMMGWATPELLITPPLPKLLAEDPLLLLLKRRERARKGLLPEGEYNKRAKDLLLHKKLAFTRNEKQLLSLHLQLAKLFVGGDTDPTPFFERVVQAPVPYETLAENYALLNQLSVASPFALLKQGWWDLLKIETAAARYGYIEELFGRVDLTALKEPFLIAFGRKLSSAAAHLIAQYFSEPLGLPPPILSDWEKRLQSAAYRHLSHFLSELEGNPPLSHEQLLEEEIALFSKAVPLDPTVETLAYYFSTP